MSKSHIESRQARSDFAEVLTIAAWFGFVTGFLEASLFTVIRLTPGWITWNMRQVNVSYEFFWIAPAVNTALFLVVALLIGGAGLVTRRVPILRGIAPQEVAVFLCGWAAAYSTFRVPGRLYRWAAIALALGVSVRLWQWYRTAPAARVSAFRRSVGWLAAAVVVAAVVTRGVPELLEVRNVRALPALPRDTPSVLLIVLDTVRADHLSAYGYHRPTTPNIDRLAREGVLFDTAISPSSWTLASHASIFTGRPVQEHGADSERPYLGPEYPTLAEAMRSHGFATAGFSANMSWVNSNTGLSRGFLHFEDYFRTVASVVPRSVLAREAVTRLATHFGERGDFGHKTGAVVSQEFLHWLDGQPGRPFFAFLNYLDAHAPYISPAEYHTRFMTEGQRAREGRYSFRLPGSASELTPDDRDMFAAAYDGALASLDSDIGSLVEELRRRGRLEHTVIVITSDHGEALGEHDEFGHGQGLYIEELHVPLIIRFPGRVPAGRRMAGAVSTTDIAATLLDIVGIRPGVLPGSPLRRQWEGAPDDRGEAAAVLSQVGHRDGVPSKWPISQGWVRSLVGGGWHYIERQNGKAELFDLRADPNERRDRLADPAAHPAAGSFRQRLATLTGSRSE